MSAEFEPIGAEVVFDGGVVQAGTERFRYPDGAEVTRDKIWHPGAVGVLALDDENVWLTRQPREVGGATASLEIPAGKLDVPGEPPIETARRELAEEIGKAAEQWVELLVFYTSPGISDERLWLYLATGLTEALHGGAEEDERIEVVPWPLDRLDQAIEECEDAKSLIALLWLAARRRT